MIMKTLLAMLLLGTLAAKAQVNVLDAAWVPNPAAQSNQLYRVYVSTNSGPFGLAGSTVGTTFSITNVQPGTYGVSITASNIWGETAKSPPVFISGPVMLPTVPTGVTLNLRQLP